MEVAKQMIREQQMEVRVEFPGGYGRLYSYLVPKNFPFLKKGDWATVVVNGNDKHPKLVQITADEGPATNRASVFLHGYVSGTEHWDAMRREQEVRKAEAAYINAKRRLQELLPNANL